MHFLVFYVRPLKPSALPALDLAGQNEVGDFEILPGNIAYIKNIRKISHPEAKITDIEIALLQVFALARGVRLLVAG